MLGSHQIISTASTAITIADHVIGQIYFIQSRSHRSVSTFTVVHPEILVYVQPLRTSVAFPTVPVIQIIVVYPVGIHPMSLTLISDYLTIVIDMIIVVNQDSVLL